MSMIYRVIQLISYYPGIAENRVKFVDIPHLAHLVDRQMTK